MQDDRLESPEQPLFRVTVCCLDSTNADPRAGAVTGTGLPLEVRRYATPPANPSTVTQYDQASRPVRVIVQAPSTPVPGLTTSPVGVPSADPNTPGFVVSAARYDLQGNKIGETDRHGYETVTVYDPLYRAVRIVSPSVPGESQAAPARSYPTQRRFDPAGNKTFEQDGNGHARRWSFDFANRWIAATDAVGRIQRRGYDANGNVTLERSEANGIVQLRRETSGYDGFNRATQVRETVQSGSTSLLYHTTDSPTCRAPLLTRPSTSAATFT